MLDIDINADTSELRKQLNDARKQLAGMRACLAIIEAYDAEEILPQLPSRTLAAIEALSECRHDPDLTIGRLASVENVLHLVLRSAARHKIRRKHLAAAAGMKRRELRRWINA